MINKQLKIFGNNFIYIYNIKVQAIANEYNIYIYKIINKKKILHTIIKKKLELIIKLQKIIIRLKTK